LCTLHRTEGIHHHCFLAQILTSVIYILPKSYFCQIFLNYCLIQDVVGQLWLKYLQKNEVAFCDEEPDVIAMDQKKMTGRHRNIYTMPPSVKQRSKLYKLGSFLDTLDEQYGQDFEDLDEVLSVSDYDVDDVVKGESREKKRIKPLKGNAKSKGCTLPRKQKSNYVYLLFFYQT